MTSALPLPAGAADDAELVLAAVGGDRRAFAAIYDRYADRLFDFCVGMLGDHDAAADCVQDAFVIATTKLGQLREVDRLRSWLYAIARNEALARIRERRREEPVEVLPELASAELSPEMLASRNELADLIAEAFGGLSDRDQAVYELAYRQGLDGLELAAALGVSHTNANTLVGRLRNSIERSLGALLVCRGAQADPQACRELAGLLQHWDGRFTVLMRKRVARHIESCLVCEQERRRRVSPAALLGSAPVLVPAPDWLREPTLVSYTEWISPPATPQVSASAEAGGSWWPPHDFDTADLTDFAPPSAPGVARYESWEHDSALTESPTATAPLVPAALSVRSLPADAASVDVGGHLRLVLLVAALMLALIGGALWGRPLIYQVWPVSVPAEPIAPTPSTTPATNAPSTTSAAVPPPNGTPPPARTSVPPTRAEPTQNGTSLPTRTRTAAPTRAERRDGGPAVPPQPTTLPTQVPTVRSLPTTTAQVPAPRSRPRPPPDDALPQTPPANEGTTAVPDDDGAVPRRVPPPTTVTEEVPPGPRLGGSDICHPTTVCEPTNGGIR